jgi:DNA repair exonuclease SbcCD ATPase subunit
MAGFSIPQVSESFGYQQSVTDLRHALEMKEVLIQQLSNRPENPEDMQMIEQLQQDKMELSNRIEQYNEAFLKLTIERDQIAEQYQRYIEQLRQKVQDLESQVKFCLHAPCIRSAFGANSLNSVKKTMLSAHVAN